MVAAAKEEVVDFFKVPPPADKRGFTDELDARSTYLLEGDRFICDATGYEVRA